MSIIFASIVLLGSLISTCGGLAGSSMTEMELQAGGLKIGLDESRLSPGLERELFETVRDGLGSIYTYTAVIGLVFTAMSAWLLALGIGQLGYRRWARGQTVLWGWAAIAVLVGFIAFTTLVIGPAYQSIFDFAAKHAPTGELGLKVSMGNMGMLAGAGAAIFSTFVLLPYPIILLAFFRKDALKEAMTR